MFVADVSGWWSIRGTPSVSRERVVCSSTERNLYSSIPLFLSLSLSLHFSYYIFFRGSNIPARRERDWAPLSVETQPSLHPHFSIPSQLDVAFFFVILYLSFSVIALRKCYMKLIFFRPPTQGYQDEKFV